MMFSDIPSITQNGIFCKLGKSLKRGLTFRELLMCQTLLLYKQQQLKGARWHGGKVKEEHASLKTDEKNRVFLFFTVQSLF